ncbi:MAG: prepilin-type N-terminal cleavage/methylation domain-containing protein [Peptococcaceae bacterium]|nr:MAG: prepilin-type N-terminal cleavage/methylation domain-containing protein [Peptococcaceae bacterium]
MKRYFKRVKNLLKGAKGFTLLELIVVIAIMGFLVAMIAPRLAGVVSGAVRNTDDSNMQRIASVTSTFNEKTGRLPNDLTNLIVETSGGYEMPSVSDSDPATKEALSADMVTGLGLKLHYLTAAEAEELSQMGITHVRNLNPSITVDEKFNGTNPTADYMERVEVAVDVPVLMVGAGYDGTAWQSDLNEGYDKLKAPELAYRIVLGVGPDSELVTSGQVQNAALSPGGITNSEHFLFNNYLLVLPRLSNTVEGAVGVGDDPGRELPTYEITVEGRPTGEKKTVNLEETQASWQFVTVGPQGNLWPAGSADTWMINEAL